MRKVPVLLLAACLTVCLVGCAAEQEPQLCRIRFDRGHGSLWGNQLTVEVCPEEIILLRYIPEEAVDMELVEHLPITDAQWDALCDALGAMKLKKERAPFWRSLLPNNKLDGGEFRKLVLYWKTDRGEEAVSYVWPQGPEAEAAEKMLEGLIPAVQQGG